MANGLKLEIRSLAELSQGVDQFYCFIQSQQTKFVAFYGNMGAGKTTFIAALLKKMGVQEAGASPTFALINEYRSTEQGKIYHCDFYRLKSTVEALDLGVEEIFNENAWVFAEWPEKLGNLLPEKRVNVKITDQNGSRIIEVNV